MSNDPIFDLLHDRELVQIPGTTNPYMVCTLADSLPEGVLWRAINRVTEEFVAIINKIKKENPGIRIDQIVTEEHGGGFWATPVAPRTQTNLNHFRPNPGGSKE